MLLILFNQSGAGVASISVAPVSMQAGQTGVVLTVTGVGTTWLSVAPVFSFTGFASLTITNTTVIDDTHATITVDSGVTFGLDTLHDATSGASTLFTVTAAPVLITKPTGLVEHDGIRGGYITPSQWMDRSVGPPLGPITRAEMDRWKGIQRKVDEREAIEKEKKRRRKKRDTEIALALMYDGDREGW